MFTQAIQKLGASPALALLRNRSILQLWLAQMISLIGDMAQMIVVPVTVYKATGSKSALGIAFICGTVPALLFSLLGGVLADRWPQKRTMIAADLARGASLLLLLHVANAKHFGPHDLSLFYVVSFLVASFSCFFGPARQSLMRVVVPKEQMMQANSLMFSGMQGCYLLGPVVGALLLAYFSAKSVFVFDALTFAVSAAIVSGIRLDPAAAALPRKVPRGPAGVWEDAREGVLYIAGSRVLRPALILLLCIVTSSEITNNLEFPFVRDLWHGGSGQFATLISLGFAASLLAGTAGMGPLSTVPPARLLLAGLTLMGLSGLVFAQTNGIVLGGAMLFVSGVGNSVANIGNMTLFQTTAPPEMQGRVSATISLCMKMAMTVGALLLVGLTTKVTGGSGLRLIFSGVAVAYLLCGTLAWFTLKHLTNEDVAEAGREAEKSVAEPSRA